MAYKILVISPLHNLGSSTVSAMLNQALTFYNKTSMLTFMQSDNTIPHYLGIEEINDPTRSIMQVVKLLDTGALREQDILDYAHQYAQNSYLLNVADPSLTANDRLQLVTHVFEHAPTDVVIVDDSADITEQSVKDLIELTDMTFVVINMSDTAAYHMKVWMTETQLKDNPNIFVCVNCYNEVVSDMRNFARSIGMPANRVAKVHYNPWITKSAHLGQLQTVLPFAHDYDYRVAELDADFRDINRCLDSVILSKLKKGF